MRPTATQVPRVADCRGSAEHEFGDFVLGVARDSFDNDGDKQKRPAESDARQCVAEFKAMVLPESMGLKNSS